MADIHIRDVDSEILAGLRRQAAEHGRSIDAEAKAILETQMLRAAQHGQFNWRAAADDLRRQTAGRIQTPSEVLLRESREER